MIHFVRDFFQPWMNTHLMLQWIFMPKKGQCLWCFYGIIILDNEHCSLFSSMNWSNGLMAFQHNDMDMSCRPLALFSPHLSLHPSCFATLTSVQTSSSGSTLGLVRPGCSWAGSRGRGRGKCRSQQIQISHGNLCPFSEPWIPLKRIYIQ